jgi:hypothetical protein
MLTLEFFNCCGLKGKKSFEAKIIICYALRYNGSNAPEPMNGATTFSIITLSILTFGILEFIVMLSISIKFLLLCLLSLY